MVGVMYPIFVECEQFTIDDYWIGIFRDCAKGRFPKGLRFISSANTLVVRPVNGPTTRTKLVRYNLPNEAKRAFDVLMNIFRTQLLLRSTDDIRSYRQTLLDQTESNPIPEPETWKDVSPKAKKEQLLIEYVSNLGNDYDMTPEETKAAYSVISAGISFKNILPKNIRLEAGKIAEIDCIEIDPDTHEVCITAFIQQTASTSKSSPKNCLEIELEKYRKMCRTLTM